MRLAGGEGAVWSELGVKVQIIEGYLDEGDVNGLRRRLIEGGAGWRHSVRSDFKIIHSEKKLKT